VIGEFLVDFLEDVIRSIHKGENAVFVKNTVVQETRHSNCVYKAQEKDGVWQVGY
jgi:hypothetical protein